MTSFREIVDSTAGSKFILQGDAAFALGVVHAGFHAVDGYPGTPSTDVIDDSLAFVQDRMVVGWSVSEAVAVSVALGHAIAGYDSLVTMKIPGVFQAGDAISSSAFFSGECGAFVLFVAADFIPSSTQHLVDPRYFFSSICIPILEPRDHQEMYDIAAVAADMSKKFRTPIVILASGVLSHSEGLVKTKEPRTITPAGLPRNITEWMNLPAIARRNYNNVITNRLPAIEESNESAKLVRIADGTENWGIITCGVNDIIVKEALQLANIEVPTLSLANTSPVPKKIIKQFYDSVPGKVFVIEDGYRYLWEKIRSMGLDVIGKEETSPITEWTPDLILEFLSSHLDNFNFERKHTGIDIHPIARPPSICPGCPYRAFALTIKKLKRKKKLFASFGDIGCSTLLYFFNALDTVVCMGASDSMRQGFVLSRPDMANRVISIIGDSTECHSGLDSTRNAVFRGVPGVKVILDNRITAMTGGQVAPSSSVNLAGYKHDFDLKRAVEAEGCRTVIVDGYDLNQIEDELKKALALADEGIFSALIIEGHCINGLPKKDLTRKLEIDHDVCVNCGICNICTGIELDDNRHPSFTVFCSNCGYSEQICKQICPKDGAIIETQTEAAKQGEFVAKLSKFEPRYNGHANIGVNRKDLPQSLRIAVRGIGGQGNLFFGKVLSEVALRTPYSDMRIVKGDTHGMAQLGGPVISVFCCGDVFSPVLATNSVDILVAMEINEALRPGFIDLAKAGGTIIFNDFKALPASAKMSDYPDFESIENSLNKYNVIVSDFYRAAFELGDVKGLTANVVALGLVSTIEPCDKIPEEIWLDAISAASPIENVKTTNIAAFRKGRELI